MSTGPLGTWQLPDELVLLRDTVRRFMRDVVRPIEDSLPHDATGPGPEHLAQLQQHARASGLWALQTPTELGGAG